MAFHTTSPSFPPSADWHPPTDTERVSFDTDSNDTEDGLPGPGRSMDVLLTIAGRRIDRFLARTAVQLDRGPNALVLRTMRSDTDSNDTEDGLPGPGRSMDVFFTIAGRRIDRLLARIAVKLGRDPNALVLRTMRSVAANMPTSSSTPLPCFHVDPQTMLKHVPRNADMRGVLDWMLRSPCLFCQSCRERFARALVKNKAVQGLCRKLVRSLEYADKPISFRRTLLMTF
jgi:hypothetical protein